MCGGVTHLIESDPAEVVQVVARQVVAGVVLLARGATVNSCLLGGFDSFGAGEQPTGWYPRLEEWPVVRPPLERGGLGDQALTGEVVQEQPFDLGGTNRRTTRQRGRVGQVA